MVNYFSENITFELKDTSPVTAWLERISSQYNEHIEELNYIFCSDDYLLEMNKTHLEHDFYTDILTFGYQSTPIMGDIFISIDRVKDNASTFKVPFEEELYRVMVHGLLHILGFDDHSEEDKREMRAMESASLELLNLP